MAKAGGNAPKRRSLVPLSALVLISACANPAEEPGAADPRAEIKPTTETPSTGEPLPTSGGTAAATAPADPGGAGPTIVSAAAVSKNEVDTFADADISDWHPFHDAGSTLTSGLVAGAAGQAMRLGYNVGPGGYAGIEKTTAAGWAWTGSGSLDLSINAQATGHTIQIEIYDSDNERFSTTIDATWNGWKTVSLRLDQFKKSGWQPAGAVSNGALDLQKVKGLAIVPSKTGTGRIDIDTIMLGIATIAPPPAGPEAPLPTTPAIPPPAATPPAAPPPVTTPTATDSPLGSLVPLYTYPSHPSWNAIISAKAAHPQVPIVAVVNPGNGPGTAVDAAYTAGIGRLQATGIKVLGYVATGYTARTAAQIQADMDHWRTWYPVVEGIFFDEMSNTAGQEGYYRSADGYARAKGFTYTVGNPGSDTRPEYVGVVDMILVYENAGLRSLPSWHSSYPRERFGIISYAVASIDADYMATARQTVGFIYMTNDVLPNPWDSLPPYFGDLVGKLAI